MLLYWKDEDVHFQVLNDIPGVRLSDSIWNVDILRSEEWKNSDVMLIKVKQWRNNGRKLQCSSWAPSSHRFLSCPQQTHTLANRKRIINQQPCLCLSVLHLSVYRCLTTSCSFSDKWVPEISAEISAETSAVCGCQLVLFQWTDLYQHKTPTAALTLMHNRITCSHSAKLLFPETLIIMNIFLIREGWSSHGSSSYQTVFKSKEKRIRWRHTFLCFPQDLFFFCYISYYIFCVVSLHF